MDLIEAGQKIKDFERQVMWRKRWLAIQDRLAMAIIVGGLLSAAAILYVRLRAIEVSLWAAAALVFGVTAAFLGARWYLTRTREREAAFMIDEALDLEDRVSSAAMIIERGAPEREVERALLDDTAGRISGKKTSDVLPYRMPRWYGLAAAAALMLGVAIFIPQKSLPGGEALAQERAGIEMAGEELEQAAREVEEIAPVGTETATLAKEQAELGRALRRSNDTRAEALKKLSALGERIEQRHEELASTRADEIVSLAEKRLSSALAAIPKPASKSDPKRTEGAGAESNKDQSNKEKSPAAAAPDAPAAGQGDEKKSKPQANNQAGNQETKKDQEKPSAPDSAKQDERKQAEANAKGQQGSKREDSPREGTGGGKAGQEPAKSQENRKPASEAQQNAGGQQAGQGEKGSDQKTQANNASPARENPPAAASKDESKDGSKDESKDEQPQAGTEQKDSGLFPTLSNLPNAVTNAVTEQAAKALPSLSNQLLQKAEEIRANGLKPEDIQQLRQAAEFLAKDLSQIAQSKQLQQAVEQMARQINPEQLEQVARQILSQEKVRKELEAAARLLAQNRQIKEFVAGLDRDFNRNERPNLSGERAQDGGERGSDGASGERQGRNREGRGGRDLSGKGQSPGAGEALKGKGREARVAGAMDRKPGGEYLFLQTKPGTGAVRVPYSSAYPQYRRQAERSVERSNVPPHMRSVVRSYFDAINPDGKKP